MIARQVRSTRSGISRLGFLYAVNIADAAFGPLITGFYLLPIYANDSDARFKQRKRLATKIGLE